MDLSEILWGTGGIAAVIMTLIQVSKIEVNPWSWIAKHLGRAINGEVMEHLGTLDKKVDRLESDIEKARGVDEQRDIEARRVRILRFGEELLQDKKHTKEHFDQTLMDITRYEMYCKTHPEFENNVTDLTVAHIKAVYQKCWQEHSFL